MRVALVHDCLQVGGEAERVLRVLHRIYPQAPVYVAFRQRHAGRDRAPSSFADWDIRTTWLQRWPAIARTSSLGRALLPWAWESLDLSAYDLVISVSGHGISQAVLTRAETLHISYCLTPPRDWWERLTVTGLPPFAALSAGWLPTWLRHYDFYAAQRVDRFIAPAERTARRIGKFYRRSAEVIPPPVTVLGEGKAGDQYYLYHGPLEPSQRVDWAIAACNQLHLPLWIAGTGSDRPRLQQLAGPTIRFVGAVADLPTLYAGAKALLDLAPTADFSFAVVEAMGRGIPAIACAHSGLRDVILDYRTGMLFAEPNADSLMKALNQFMGLRFPAQACIQRAAEFAESVFVAKFEWFVAQALDEHRQRGPLASFAHGPNLAKTSEED